MTSETCSHPGTKQTMISTKQHIFRLNMES